MNPTLVGAIVFGCTFGGALLGFWLQARAKPHLDAESRDTVKTAIGLVATMTALILGLITASAKSSFDAVNLAVKSSATDILTLDRLLARYGPETRELRGAFQHAVARRIDMTWPTGSSLPVQLDPSRLSSDVEGLAEQVRALTPRDDSQRSLQARALDVAEKLLEARWLVSAGSDEASVPVLFLVVMLFWLTITFASFGLLATRNATVVTFLFVSAVSVGSALFLILEMDGPFGGLLRVSADPLRFALAHLNQ